MKEGAGARSLGVLLWPPDKVARKSAVSVGTGAAVRAAAAGVGAGSVWAMHGVQTRRARRRTRTVAEVFIPSISLSSRHESRLPTKEKVPGHRHCETLIFNASTLMESW
jgi:hypothetical protein